MKGSDNTERGNRRPDASFGNAPAGRQGNRPADPGAPRRPQQTRGGSQAQQRQGAQERPADGRYPGTNAGRSPRGRQPAGNRPSGGQAKNVSSGKGGRAPQGQQRQPGQQVKRPAGAAGQKSGGTRRSGGTDLRKAPAGRQDTRGKGSAAAGKPGKKKRRFTKKQAIQVTGLIVMLILVMGLALVLLFNHYFGFLKPVKDWNDSTPMTYSDVDLSKADTFEKSVEDEKLKELTAKAEYITSSDVMNILLIGEDLRDTEEESTGNTDVMMLISVNKKDNTLTLTSIMRDCYVAFEDDNGWWYSDRINAAYHYGGMKLTKQTIENYMNVKIDRYVLVNFKVFIDIVDSLGGIDMHVTDLEANGDPNDDPNGDNTRGMQNPLDEQNKYLGNKKKTDYIKKGGDLHLNGNQALAYARLRHVGNSDYERTQRQRKVIKEMIKKSRKMSLVQMDQLATKVFPQVKTDVTKGELAGLLLEMLNYRNYKLQEFRVPADGTFSDEVIDGKDVLSVDFSMNQEKFFEKAYGTVEVEKKSDEEDTEDDENRVE